MRKLFIILIVLGGATRLEAQNLQGDIKFRLAQSYERSQDYESAVKLYEELYAKDSLNFVIFDALYRGYMQLKRYDGAISLIQRKLQQSPNDIGLLSQLGTIYARESQEPQAFEIWDRAIAVDPTHESTYRIVVNSMMENRMLDRAIAAYRQGRSSCGNPTLFTGELASLYSTMLNYGDATKEYLALLHQNPAQLDLVIVRISSYTGRSEGLNAATLVVEQAAKTEPNNLSNHQLLAWLYMEGKQFDKAYAVYKIIDEQAKTAGYELYNFAERALKEKAYTAASNAFQDVLNKFSQFERRAQAKFGYARTLEEQNSETDTLNPFGSLNPFTGDGKPATEAAPKYAGAINAYSKVITEFPTTEIAAQSLLRIAILKFERFFDLDGARIALETIAKQYPAYSAVLGEARLRLGDVYLTMDDMEKAEAQYKTLSAQQPVMTQHREKAQLRLSELEYFRGNFQAVLASLKTLTRVTVSDVTNDALSLLIFIQENQKPTDAALKDYARADLLKRQHKLSEALTVFESIVQKYGGTRIIDETLMSIGDALAYMKRYPEAIANYERLVKEFPESVALDRVLVKIGQVYQSGLKDKPKAIESYQKLLLQFPNSIYAGQVRKRVRELRGDNI